MPAAPSPSGASASASTFHSPLAISKWVNERYPPLNELLSAHDVARLTRRPRWMLTGLCLIGRFPKKLTFRGRGIGWRRSEVLDWMSRDPAVAPGREATSRASACKHPRQACLPLECTSSCAPARHRPAMRCRNRTLTSRVNDK